MSSRPSSGVAMRWSFGSRSENPTLDYGQRPRPTQGRPRRFGGRGVPPDARAGSFLQDAVAGHAAHLVLAELLAALRTAAETGFAIKFLRGAGLHRGHLQGRRVSMTKRGPSPALG